MYDAIVIGSGIGGLTTADLLSKRGKRVLVLEQSGRLGGCCASFDLAGHKFDVGAIFILYKELYQRFFEMMGLSLENHIQMKLLDPVYDMRFSDGTSVILPMDPVESADVIARFAPSDRTGWLDFCREMKNVWEAVKVLVDKPFPPLEEFGTPSHMLKTASSLRLLRSVPSILRAALTTQERVNRRYMQDGKSLAIVSFENLFAGLPANRINGIFAVMSYLGHEGYWYPMGGMGSIPDALARIARENGAEIRLNTLVRKVLVEGGRALGVELDNGESVTSRVVVSNASAIPTYLDLVGRENLPGRFARTIENCTLSIPAPIAYFALARRPEQVRCHFTVMTQPPEQMNAYWDDYYAQGLMPPFPDLPHGLVCPSISDPSLSPDSKFSLEVISAGPYELKYHDWDRYKHEYLGDAARDIERRMIPGFGELVDHKDMRTPLDFERELLLPQGAIYGLEMSVSNLGPFRPAWRSPVVENLYLTGASTNPGGGVPLVMISGINCSACVVRDKGW